VLRQRHPRPDAGLDELLQPGTQDIGSDAQIVFEFVEALHAVTGLTQDQNGSAIADNFHGARHGTFLVGETALLDTGHSIRSLRRLDLLHNRVARHQCIVAQGSLPFPAWLGEPRPAQQGNLMTCICKSLFAIGRSQAPDAR
jgi:hypothetical protein